MRKAATSYERIATEYYSERHITSRNFDQATAAFFKNQSNLIPNNGLILDLGSGRGSVGHYFSLSKNRVIQADLSMAMLTLTSREPSAGKVLCDAQQLPFDDKVFSAVTAFLFDPFNGRKLFQEIERILCHNGVFIGSLPTKLWGNAIRKLRGYPFDVARFISKEGVNIDFKSVLMSEDELSRSLKRAGFSDIKIEEAYLPSYVNRISPDISEVVDSTGRSIESFPIISIIIAKAS